jgi:hypothetical protein
MISFFENKYVNGFHIYCIKPIKTAEKKFEINFSKLQISERSRLVLSKTRRFHFLIEFLKGYELFE